jgi:hypothetical protein
MKTLLCNLTIGSIVVHIVLFVGTYVVGSWMWSTASSAWKAVSP